MTKEELKRNFEQIVSEYTNKFCERMYGEAHHDSDFWIAGDVGGVICIGDEYWNFEQIRKTIDNDYNPKEVFAWYDYCLRLSMIDHTIDVPNLEAWMLGCPRYTEEQIKNIEDQISNIHESINNLKKELPGSRKENKCAE